MDQLSSETYAWIIICATYSAGGFSVLINYLRITKLSSLSWVFLFLFWPVFFVLWEVNSLSQYLNTDDTDGGY